MIDSVALEWSPIDWVDPDGGIIRLWPTLPTVVYPDSLRRTIGQWDGIAFLLPTDEPDVWDEQVVEEKASPGINRDGIAASGGILGRMMEGMSAIEGIQVGRFPDPEPRRLLISAQSEAGRGSRPIFFVEPDDEEWTEWVESCADEMTRPLRLLGLVFGGRAWKKELVKAMKHTSPPRLEKNGDKARGLAEASSLAAAWWCRSEASFTDELRSQRDARLCARLRGSLSVLREGQVDVDIPPVLLVPVMQAWMPSIHNALLDEPKPESME
ncbi:MAG: hypothetical protein QGF94_00790 [Candidatus Thalassarchaeaceae archaeon]|jgi:hypothetical protein|nr:hypothetical protein [Candidatus Thalassarchaeaceae archaeon]